MTVFLEEAWVRGQLPPRPRDAHKGGMGTLTVVGGSARFRGAPVLAAHGALRAGAGLVRIAATEKVCAAAASVPCATLLPLAEDEAGGVAPLEPARLADILKSDALLAGCGMGATPSTAAVVTKLLGNASRPLILDADALNTLDLGALKNTAAPVAVTPHVGEMARLCGLTAPEVAQRQENIAREFAREYRCTVVLKSHVTVIAAPGGALYVNDKAGNPGLARGGSGDVLAGIVAALTARGLAPPVAAACGVWLHAAAADLAARDLGQNGMLPSDLPLYLGRLWRDMGL